MLDSLFVVHDEVLDAAAATRGRRLSAQTHDDRRHDRALAASKKNAQ